MRLSKSAGEMRNDMKCPSIMVGLIVLISSTDCLLAAPNIRSNSRPGSGGMLAKTNHARSRAAAGDPMRISSFFLVMSPITRMIMPTNIASMIGTKSGLIFQSSRCITEEAQLLELNTDTIDFLSFILWTNTIFLGD